MIALVLDGSSLREVTVSIFSSSSTATQTPNPTHGVLTLIGALAGLSLFTTGCYAEVETRPAVVTYSASARVQPVVVQEEEEVYYADTAPVVEIETYPSVVYSGRPVYYVDGRWYYRGPRGWAYYRSEPRGLVTQRVELERRYPERFHVNAHVNTHVNAHVNAHTEARPVEVTTHREVEAAHPTVKVHEDVKVKETVKVKENVSAGGSVGVGGSVKTTTKVTTKSTSKDRR